MLRLVNSSVTPHGGFRYRDERTGKEFQAWTLFSLLHNVRNYLEANKLPIPIDLQARIEDYTCRDQGPGVCEETDPRRSWLAGMQLSFRVVMAGTKILGSWLLAGLPKVPQEQADSRSAICAGCPFNKEASDCQPCALPAFHSLVNQLIGKSRSVHHDQLRACAACGCSLQAKVWVPLEHLTKSFDYGDKLPDHCWLNKEMSNG